MPKSSKPAVQQAAFTAIESLEQRRLLASISGFIFNDPSGNGVLDPGEVAQPGVTVFIDADGNRALDAGERSTVTNERGEYRFDDVEPGNYLIYAIPPEGQAQTLPGPSGGLRRLGNFDIDIVFMDNGLTAAQKQIVNTAAAKWESIIIGDLPDVIDDGRFGPIDDIRLEVRTFSESGNNLGFSSSGGVDNSLFDPDLPAVFRSEEDGYFPYVGNLNLNLQNIGADEQEFNDVTLHEIGHALGFQPRFWNAKELLRGFTTGSFGFPEAGPNPQFIGSNALREYNETFGFATDAVPLENVGQAAHWRESVFGSELMSPNIGPAAFNPLSRVTVGAFQDMGYAVDYAAADVYIPSGGLGTEQGPGTVVGDDAFANLVKPFEVLAVVASDSDNIEAVNFAHRLNTRPTIEVLQAITALNSLTNPVALAGDLIEVEAINAVDADVRANDIVTTVVFWQETNGIPGLQSKGPDQDQYIAIDDAAGRFRVQDETDLGDAGSEVTYYARAYDRTEVASKVATTTVFLSPPLPVPEKPAVLRARPVDSDTIRLDWRDNSDLEEGFRIEVSPTGRFNGEQTVYIAPANTTTVEIDGAAPGQTLVARVRSFNISGQSAFTGRAAVASLGSGEILINATGPNSADGGTVSSSGFSAATATGALYDDTLLSTSRTGVANFSANIPAMSNYALFFQYPANVTGSTDVLVEVIQNDLVMSSFEIDQSRGGGGFSQLGTAMLQKGAVTVRVNAGSSGTTFADAVRLLPLAGPGDALTSAGPAARPFNTVFSMRVIEDTDDVLPFFG